MPVALKSERFEMRLNVEMIDRIDGWRASQDGFPSRAEAIRYLANLGLERAGQPIFSDGEKMITLMLCDVVKRMGITDGVDPDVVKDAIHGGHYWGLPYKYPGIYHSHIDSNIVVKETLDFLCLWDCIEFSYSRLSGDDKEKIQVNAAPFGADVKFVGFDGNFESEHLGVAQFFIQKVGRFEIFNDGRNLNSHVPTRDAYRRMMKVFDPNQNGFIGNHLSADRIIQILKEWNHPDNR